MGIKKSPFIFLITSILFMQGCVSTVLTNRFKKATFSTESAGADLIQVSAFVLDVPSASLRNFLFELSPQAQSTLVHEIAAKTGSIEAFLNAVKSGGGEEKSGGDIIDATKFKKRVVFSVEKSFFNNSDKIGPADRVSELLVRLAVPTSAHFISWNRFETKYESVDLGKVNLTQSNQVGLEGTMIPKTSLLPQSIPISAQFSRNMAEEVSLKQRFVSISGALASQDARLYQQGVVGIDLAGNFLVDFDIQLDENLVDWKTVTQVGNLNSKGIFNPGDKVQVSFKMLKYPKKSIAVTCAMGYDFVLRHVLDKSHSVIEGDDWVQFVMGQGKNEFELLGKTDLKTRIYTLRSHHPQGKEVSPAGYELHLNGFTQTPVYFLNFGMARDFLNWLNETKSTKIAQFGLELDGQPLNVKDIPSLEIESIDLN